MSIKNKYVPNFEWSEFPMPKPFRHICMYIYKHTRCQFASVVFDSLQPYGFQPIFLLCPWDFPGKTTGGGYMPPSRRSSHSQPKRSNPHLLSLLHWPVGSLPLALPERHIHISIMIWQSHFRIYNQRKRKVYYLKEIAICMNIFPMFKATLFTVA